ASSGIFSLSLHDALPVVGATWGNAFWWGWCVLGECRVGELVCRVVANLDLGDPPAPLILAFGAGDVANGFQFPDSSAHRVSPLNASALPPGPLNELINSDFISGRVGQELGEQPPGPPR